MIDRMKFTDRSRSSFKFRRRRPNPGFVSCDRQNFVLLAVTKVAGYGLQGPCRPRRLMADAFECGRIAGLLSAVVALCQQGRVWFVVVS